MTNLTNKISRLFRRLSLFELGKKTHSFEFLKQKIPSEALKDPQVISSVKKTKENKSLEKREFKGKMTPWCHQINAHGPLAFKAPSYFSEEIC